MKSSSSNSCSFPCALSDRGSPVGCTKPGPRIAFSPKRALRTKGQQVIGMVLVRCSLARHEDHATGGHSYKRIISAPGGLAPGTAALKHALKHASPHTRESRQQRPRGAAQSTRVLSQPALLAPQLAGALAGQPCREGSKASLLITTVCSRLPAWLSRPHLPSRVCVTRTLSS